MALAPGLPAAPRALLVCPTPELTSLGFLEAGSEAGRLRLLEDVTDIVRRDVSRPCAPGPAGRHGVGGRDSKARQGVWAEARSEEPPGCHSGASRPAGALGPARGAPWLRGLLCPQHRAGSRPDILEPGGHSCPVGLSSPARGLPPPQLPVVSEPSRHGGPRRPLSGFPPGRDPTAALAASPQSQAPPPHPRRCSLKEGTASCRSWGALSGPACPPPCPPCSHPSPQQGPGLRPGGPGGGHRAGLGLQSCGSAPLPGLGPDGPQLSPPVLRCPAAPAPGSVLDWAVQHSGVS